MSQKQKLLDVALILAEEHGYQHITRNDVAKAAGLSGTIVHYYFGTMVRFRSELMRYALEQRNATVIAQGIMAFNATALNADDELKTAALTVIAKRSLI